MSSSKNVSIDSAILDAIASLPPSFGAAEFAKERARLQASCTSQEEYLNKAVQLGKQIYG